MWLSENSQCTRHILLSLDPSRDQSKQFHEKQTDAAAMQCAPKDARIKEGWYSVQPNGEQGNKRNLEMSNHTRMQWKMNVQMKNCLLSSHISMFSSTFSPDIYSSDRSPDRRCVKLRRILSPQAELSSEFITSRTLMALFCRE